MEDKEFLELINVATKCLQRQSQQDMLLDIKSKIKEEVIGMFVPWDSGYEDDYQSYLESMKENEWKPMTRVEYLKRDEEVHGKS